MTAADLQNYLESYLGLRRATGFAMRTEERLLRDFLAFLNVEGSSESRMAQAALNWACSRGGTGSSWQSNRLSVARCFLVYLRAHVPDVQIPSSGLIPHALRPTPFIYSEVQTADLIQQARCLKPEGSLKPHTYGALIGLIASCGLRPGEALRLNDVDVEMDRQPPRLVIRQTKFRKSRIVPVHSSTAEQLRAYAATRKRLGYDGLCEAFFVSESGAALARSTVTRIFKTILRHAGISGHTGGHGPNLQCLRHSFAVRRMLGWYLEDVDVHSRLPHLSVYLGHAKPQHTYWYLTATPELLAGAAHRFESYVNPGGGL